jgi:hypothetical protein
MADKEKPRATLNIPVSAPSHKQAQMPARPAKPMKTQEELIPLASRIAENAALMQRFRAVIGSEDKEQGLRVIDEVTKYAQSLDPSISVPEGTSIVVLLMNLVGHPGDASNDRH